MIFGRLVAVQLALVGEAWAILLELLFGRPHHIHMYLCRSFVDTHISLAAFGRVPR